MEGIYALVQTSAYNSEARHQGYGWLVAEMDLKHCGSYHLALSPEVSMTVHTAAWQPRLLMRDW